MDKNIAALLRQDTRTVFVSFEQVVSDFDDVDEVPARRAPSKGPHDKQYQYVTHLDLKVGDFVVVDARGQLTVAVIRRVDEELTIEPNSDTQYKWVVGKIDMDAAFANAKRNEEIEKSVAEAYRHNLRRGFAQQILAGVDEGSRARLSNLIGVTS